MKNRTWKVFLSVLLLVSMSLSLPGVSIAALAADDLETAAEETSVLPAAETVEEAAEAEEAAEPQEPAEVEEPVAEEPVEAEEPAVVEEPSADVASVDEPVAEEVSAGANGDADLQTEEIATEAKGAPTSTDGWHQEASGVWYYIKGGITLTSTKESIGGKYYIFDDAGAMYEDVLFTFGGATYHAEKGGALTVNKWYQTGRGKWYYFNGKGEALLGRNSVSGKMYYFKTTAYSILEEDGYTREYPAGEMEASTFVTDASRLYVAGESGVLTLLNKNGWTKVGDVYYYTINNVAVTNTYNTGYSTGTIRDKGQITDSDFLWYGFAEDGHMLNNEVYIWDNSGDKMILDAREGGVLYVGEWHNDRYFRGEHDTPANMEGYAYVDTAVQLTSKMVSDGTYYVFDEDGFLVRGAVYTVDAGAGKTYISDENGLAQELTDGWYHVGDQDYYFDSGSSSLLKDKVQKIGSQWYGFDPDGALYKECAFKVPFDPDLPGLYYRARATGALIENDWYGLFYYGPADSNGPHALEGKQALDTDHYYFFSPSGEAFAAHYILITESGAKTLYYADETGLLNQVAEDGFYYDCFISDDGVTVPDNDSHKNKIVCVINGEVVTYGWQEIDGNYYYFTSAGYAYVGFQSISGLPYLFNQDGIMEHNGWATYEYNGTSYTAYATSTGILLEGEQQLEGKWFYFTDSTATDFPLNQYPVGRMLTGWVDYDGHTYFCTSDGAWKAEAKKDGWFSFEGSWYYIKGGDVVTNSYETINGAVYYFNQYGKMASNEILWGQIFQSSGARVQSGWYKFQNHWYYVEASNHRIAVDKELLIGTKYYRFDESGIMVTGSYLVGNKLYTYDSSGARTGPKDYKNGWYLASDGQWYYYKDGAPYSGPSGNGGWVGSYYVDKNGKMLTNQEIEGYWVGKDGAYIRSGWIKAPSGATYFAKAGGKLIKGEWYTDTDGKEYYFGDSYAMYTGVSQVGNSYYAFATTGELVSGLTAREGWQSAGSYGWVYIRNGVPIMNETATVDGATYSFYNGYMERNLMRYEDTYGYLIRGEQAYFANSGVKQEYTGWRLIDGAWYYFNGSNRAVVGWVIANGRSYYCDYDGMVTGWKNIDGAVYYFNQNGVLTERLNTQNGWVQRDGEWFYYKNGVAVGTAVTDNLVQIGGTTYGFVDGRLASNELIYTRYKTGPYGTDWAEEYFYVDEDGVLAPNAGWVQLNGYWFYIGADAKPYTGIHKIGGVQYSFRRAVAEDGYPVYPLGSLIEGN